MKTHHGAAMALLLSALPFCGQTGSQSSSQTHWFSSCGADGDCAEGLVCACGHCVQRCAAASECELAEGDAACRIPSSPPVAELCGAAAPAHGICFEACANDDGCGAGRRCVAGSCVPLNAGFAGSGCRQGTFPRVVLPYDLDGGCVDTESPLVAACTDSDDAEELEYRCVEHRPTGARYATRTAADHLGSAWGECTRDLPFQPIACHLRSCDLIPPSLCSAEAHCRHFGCGAPQSLMDESGCVRPECSQHEDCSTDERCRIVFQPNTLCYQAMPDTCDCAGPGAAVYTRRCVPSAPVDGYCEVEGSWLPPGELTTILDAESRERCCYCDTSRSAECAGGGGCDTCSTFPETPCRTTEGCSPIYAAAQGGGEPAYHGCRQEGPCDDAETCAAESAEAAPFLFANGCIPEGWVELPLSDCDGG